MCIEERKTSTRAPTLFSLPNKFTSLQSKARKRKHLNKKKQLRTELPKKS